MYLLKRDATPDQIVIDRLELDDEDGFSRIRCPLCEWRPTPSSRWVCHGVETPEHPFEGCGAAWNTFTTRGRCPGCQHQWRWTSCLNCAGWSPHEDWYEER